MAKETAAIHQLLCLSMIGHTPMVQLTRFDVGRVQTLR